MDKYLTLINRNQPFAESMKTDFEYTSIIDANGETFVEKQTLEAFNSLAEYLKNIYGIVVKIVSAGRTTFEQKQIYNHAKTHKSHDYAEKHVATAGNSEHHLGLALDIEVHQVRPKFIQNLIDKNKVFKRYFEKKERESGKTDEMLHMVHNVMVHYGFILRYPENKQNATGFAGNQYHIRYVGEKHSERMRDSGLTLDEYVKRHTYYEEPNPVIYI